VSEYIQIPMFLPDSDWTEPTSLPVVPSGVDLAVDVETRDNGLANDRGPGWATRDGHICGVSVAWGGEKHYIPIRHPDSVNQDPEQTMGWLQDAIDRSRRVITHGGQYDPGWLRTESVTIPSARHDDTMYQATMLDENQLKYSLEMCCRRAGVPGKDEAKLREAAAAFGCDPKIDMWRMPARYVGGYAAQDPRATLDLYNVQAPRIEEEKLTEAYRLEMDLVPMFVEMRTRGIRVNEDTAARVQRQMRERCGATLREMKDKLGWRREVSVKDINSPNTLMRMFDEQSVEYPRLPPTDAMRKKGIETGNPSFKSDWMEESEHWLPQLVVQARKLNDLDTKFIGNYILGSVHLGRIHAEIHQLRDDDGGTRSYRLSYSNPPLQQAPARSEDGRLIRTIFEAEGLWGSADMSQQEPRIAVHLAAAISETKYGREMGMEGVADDAVRYYCDDPNADFHSMVAEITGIPRKKAKIINLALMYAMGIRKMATRLGISFQEAVVMVEQYHERLPFVSKLAKLCEVLAQTRGYIRLLDGARCRFDLWEPRWSEKGSARALALPYAAALEKWGPSIKRAGVHKAMNRAVQGGAARQTKRAMLDCYNEGIIPLIQMHDELGIDTDSQATLDKVSKIMENSVKLKIPMKVDQAIGWNWGQASIELDKGVRPISYDEMMKYPRETSIQEILQRRAA
jgi:DNA polymerase I-like protein with 3'-5' exonuclease and polymerase domains